MLLYVVLFEVDNQTCAWLQNTIQLQCIPFKSYHVTTRKKESRALKVMGDFIFIRTETFCANTYFNKADSGFKVMSFPFILRVISLLSVGRLKYKIVYGLSANFKKSCQGSSGGSTGGTEGPCPPPPAGRQLKFLGHIFIELTLQISCYVAI